MQQKRQTTQEKHRIAHKENQRKENERCEQVRKANNVWQIPRIVLRIAALGLEVLK